MQKKFNRSKQISFFKLSTFILQILNLHEMACYKGATIIKLSEQFGMVSGRIVMHTSYRKSEILDYTVNPVNNHTEVIRI